MGEKVGENQIILLKNNSQSSQKHKKGLIQVSPSGSDSNQVSISFLHKKRLIYSVATVVFLPLTPAEATKTTISISSLFSQ